MTDAALAKLADDLRQAVADERARLEELVIRHDEQIQALERLVRRALCKCVIGSTSWSNQGCPIHVGFVDIQDVLRDRQPLEAARG